MMNRRKFLAATGITLLSLSNISCIDMLKNYEVIELKFPSKFEEYKVYCLKAIRRCHDNLKKDNRLVVLVDLDTILTTTKERNHKFNKRWLEYYSEKLEKTTDLEAFRKDLDIAFLAKGKIVQAGFFYSFLIKEVGHAISHIDYIEDRDNGEDDNNIMAAKFHLSCILKPESGKFSIH